MPRLAFFTEAFENPVSESGHFQALRRLKFGAIRLRTENANKLTRSPKWLTLLTSDRDETKVRRNPDRHSPSLPEPPPCALTSRWQGRWQGTAALAAVPPRQKLCTPTGLTCLAFGSSITKRRSVARDSV